MYIRNNLTNVIVSEHNLMDASCLQIKIGSNICIFAVYRPPSFKDISKFLSSLDQVINSNCSFANIMLIADINIDIMNGNTDTKSKEYLNLLAAHGLLPSHIHVTHDKTCLDHVFLKTKLNAVTIVIDSTITDHNVVLATLDKVKTHYQLIRKIG